MLYNNVSRLERDDLNQMRIVPVETVEMPEKIFVRAKPFSESVGVSYQRVLEWIAQGMPVIPDCRSPYMIIVPAAMSWLKKKYNF